MGEATMIHRRKFFASLVGVGAVSALHESMPTQTTIKIAPMRLCPHCGDALQFLDRHSELIANGWNMRAICQRCKRAWMFQFQDQPATEIPYRVEMR